MKHQAHSGYDLFRKCSRLFHTLQIKHGGGGDTQGGTQTDLFDQKGIEWHRRAGICLCVLRRRSKAHGFFVVLFFYLSVHPSTPLSFDVSLTTSAVRLCRIWTASADCVLFVCLFSGSDRIPLSLPALWSHIIPNTVKSAKHKPRVNANQIRGPLYCIRHPAVSLNPPLLVSHSLSLYFFIHSPKCGVNWAKASPVLLPDETLLNIW